ncbi:hypothetical protein KIL84_011294 [Mauremys mutica]|uniref:Uncharacterized protein n=1 Tax=Mauremys mutica TaxID=74926 RepID=A0A9D3XCR7_9SAUR|nr:hypothetical protein KIL84_011294 [Mauremys mutica]
MTRYSYLMSSPSARLLGLGTDSGKGGQLLSVRACWGAEINLQSSVGKCGVVCGPSPARRALAFPPPLPARGEPSMARGEGLCVMVAFIKRFCSPSRVGLSCVGASGGPSTPPIEGGGQ